VLRAAPCWAPSVAKPAATRKARTQRTDNGQPVHSFRTLLADLATLTRNTARWRAYKNLARVERAFRCLKTTDLDIRPILHWLSPRVRAKPQSVRCQPDIKRAMSSPSWPPSVNVAMTLQFHRAVEHMEVWSACSEGFSFVITPESRAGNGLYGQLGYVASWRRLDQYRSGAIKIGGSTFTTFVEAEGSLQPDAEKSDKQRLNGGPAVNARVAGGQDFLRPVAR
jgi:hypothetical protein